MCHAGCKYHGAGHSRRSIEVRIPYQPHCKHGERVRDDCRVLHEAAFLENAFKRRDRQCDGDKEREEGACRDKRHG